jgi:hypothetical protein
MQTQTQTTKRCFDCRGRGRTCPTCEGAGEISFPTLPNSKTQAAIEMVTEQTEPMVITVYPKKGRKVETAPQPMRKKDRATRRKKSKW